MSEILVDIQSTAADSSDTAYEDIVDMNESGVVVGSASSVILIIASFSPDLGDTDDELVAIRFAVDDVQEGPTLGVFKDGLNSGCGASLCWALTGISGSHKFALQWSDGGGNTMIMDTSRVRSFQVIEITDASLLVSEESLSSDSAVSGYTDINDLIDTQTPAGAGSILLFLANMLTSTGQSTDGVASYQFEIDAAGEGPEGLAFSDQVAGVCGMSQMWVKTGVSGSTDFALQWDEVSGTMIANTGADRTFQVVEITANAEILSAITSEAADSLTGSYTDVVDLDDTIDVVGTGSILLFSATFPGGPEDNVTGAFQFAEDSTGEGPEVYCHQDNDTNHEGCGHSAYWAVTGKSAGSHTFSLRGENVLGTYPMATVLRRSLAILELTEPVVPAAAITGTAQPTSTEPQIVDGGRTILITLTDDTWVAAGATFNAIRQDILDGLDAATSEQYGWNNEIRDKAPVTDVVRTSDTLVTITLSAQPGFDNTATETITVTVPASAVVSAAPITATPTFTVTDVLGTATTTGTATATIDEDDIVAGGKTIIVTLLNGSWVDDGAAFDAQRQNIIDAFDADESPTFGWNNEVQGKEVVTAVVRTSQRIVTITLTASPLYDITELDSPEEIQTDIPASATNIGEAVGGAQFDVIVGPIEAAVTGTLVPDGDEDEIVAGGQTIILTLTNDTWLTAGAPFNSVRQLFIDGLDSAQSELTGWNAEVRDKMAVTEVVRTSDTVVTITLLAQVGYDITAPETITVTIHTNTVTSDPGSFAATPTFDINPEPITAALTGTISPISIESQIVSGGRTLIITLDSDTWLAAGTPFDQSRQDIIDGITSAQSEATGWNNEVRDNQGLGQCVRTSDTVVTITWEPAAAYNITDNEVITVTIPASALEISGSPIVATPTFTVFEVPIAVVTGTVQPDASEAEIVAGGETIILTLIDDEWVAAGATFNAVRQDIIDGLDSAGAELLGWNNEVRDNLPVTAVVRTSATVVTITLTAQAAYDITANETITVTVPGSALDQTSEDITGIPTFNITFTAPPAGSKARDRRGGAHAEDIFDVNTPDVETFPVNKFD